MLRTAEEILNKHYYTRQDPFWDFETLEAMLNEARIEAIRECADKATAFSIGYDGHPQVDKVSILKLIDQVK